MFFTISEYLFIIFSNSNVCTVQTIDDLQKALKSEDDIQIVVPNELLETSEFKTFLSNFNSFPASDRQKTRNNSTSSSSKERGNRNFKTDSTDETLDKRNMKEAIPGIIYIKWVKFSLMYNGYNLYFIFQVIQLKNCYF